VIEIEIPRWLNLSNFVRSLDADDGEEVEQNIHSLSKTMSGSLTRPRNGLAYGSKAVSKFPSDKGTLLELTQNQRAEVLDSDTACQHGVDFVDRALLQ
jgi:hypothetical protein